MTQYCYEGVDLRKHPEAYEIGRGEQGVFHAQPYKDELLPLWKFKDVHSAEQSSQDIWDKFLEYKASSDFVGMDVARKYLQMGYTRSRRYAKHKGGTKSKPLDSEDPIKAQCATIFKAKWQAAAEDTVYQQLKSSHQQHKKRGRQKTSKDHKRNSDVQQADG